MQEFQKALGDAVLSARKSQHITQDELATRLGIDPRTLTAIENYRGNPKFDSLFPLIRELKINTEEIFYYDKPVDNPKFEQMKLLLSDCSDLELDSLFTICSTVLSVMRSEKRSKSNNKNEPASPIKEEAGSAFFTTGSSPKPYSVQQH